MGVKTQVTDLPVIRTSYPGVLSPEKRRETKTNKQTNQHLSWKKHTKTALASHFRTY